MLPTDAEIAAAKKHAHEILDDYTAHDDDRTHVRWALNFVGHERHRNEVADISHWLQR